MDKIKEKIQEQIQDRIYLGASLALFNNGKWQEFYFGESEPGKPTKASLSYDLASVSKVIGVGTICLQLLQIGKIHLDDTLRCYYPDFQEDKVTLRQLLTHTSGLDPYIPNRDHLDFKGLKEAMNHLKLKKDRSFHYTDVNFILLGFMLEELFQQDLDQIFDDHIFCPLGMLQTSFGPVWDAVPTTKHQTAGQVHDPKAQVLGNHTGSAGLFSTLKDLETFLNYYLNNDFSIDWSQSYSNDLKTRGIAWDLQDEWLLHTGYTGTFIMFHPKAQQAVIFLSNRTYEKDDRAQWILDRDQLIRVIKESLLGLGKLDQIKK